MPASFFPLLALTLLALGANMFPLSLVGIDFLLGAVFVFIALRLFGTTAGVIVAVVASSYMLLRWEQPMGMAIAGIQTLGVGLLVHRHRRHFDLPLAALLFWLPGGILLIALSYPHLLGFEASTAWMVAMKHAANGVVNAMIAAVMLDSLPLWRWLGTAAERQTKTVRRQQSHLLAGAVLFPLLAGLMIIAWHEVDAMKALARQRILDYNQQLGIRLAQWQQQNLAIASSLARHAEADRKLKLTAPELQHALQITASGFPMVATANVLDAEGTLVATSVTNAARANASSQEWFRRLRETRAPVISNVFHGAILGLPIVVAAAPISGGPASAGRFGGAAVVAFRLDELGRLIAATGSGNDVAVTLLDGRNRVINSTHPDITPLDERIPEPGHIVIEQSDNLTLSRPAKAGSPILSWQDAHYRIETPLEHGGWRLVLDMPLHNQIGELHDKLRLGLAAALLLTLAALLGGRWAAGRISRPLEQISALTTRFADGHADDSSIPASGLEEIDTLAVNFRRMTEALSRNHAELEQRIKERTEALQRETVASAEYAAKVRRVASELEQQKAAVDQHAIVSIADAAGDIIAVNDKFCEISGYAREELLGKNHRILNSGRQPKQFFIDMWIAISRGNTWHGLICNRAKNGGLYWVNSTIVPFLDSRGLPYQYVSIRTDVSALVETQTALRAAMVEAEAANHAKSLFLSNVSHEMRTPMNAIMGFSQILQHEMLSEDQADSVAHIRKASQNLMEIIDQVLTLADIESGKIDLLREAVDLRSLAREIDLLLEPLFGAFLVAHRVTVDFQKEEGEPAVLADRTRFRQVMLNLLSNAIQHNRDGGTVRVGWERRFDRVRIDITDTGPGIAPEMQPYLFTPFNRLGKEGLGIRGTGVGLVICKRLVEMMGGSIGFESSYGVGSTFWIELPAADSRIRAVVN